MSKERTEEEQRKAIVNIINKYSSPKRLISQAYEDGGIEPLWARFERATTSQLCSPDSTVSRYGIWANTVRDNLIAGIKEVQSGNISEGDKFFTRAINSLSAFSDVQALFDKS